MNPSGKVKFMYVEGETLPANADKSTIYVVGTTPKTLYIGSDPIGGGSGIDEDLIKLDSKYNEEMNEYEIAIYSSEDPESGLAATDHRPKKQSYPTMLTLNVYQESEENPTSETFVPINIGCTFGYTQSYYNQQTEEYYNTEYVSLPCYPPINLYQKTCPYNNTTYKYYYFHRGLNTDTLWEQWSNYPIIYDNVNDTNTGLFLYYDEDDNEFKNAEQNLTEEDFVQYSTSGGYAPTKQSWHYNSFDITAGYQMNWIVGDTVTYETEIVDFITNLNTLAAVDWMHGQFGSSYGMIYDFSNSIMYDKYLVIPEWFGFNDIYLNPFIDSCITHPAETPSVGDFVVFKYKNPVLYDNIKNSYDYKINNCISAVINDVDTGTKPYDVKQINIDNTDVPEGFDYFYGFYSYTNNGEDFKINIHVEYSDNALVYQNDLKNLSNDTKITSTTIATALGYTPADDAELGDRVHFDDTFNPNNINYFEVTTDYMQYITDLEIKLFPNINGSTIYGARRNTNDYIEFATYDSMQANRPISYAYLMWGNDLSANVIECPYNNKTYKYTYYLRNDYYENHAFIVYSNYVLAAVNGSVYYLNAGTSSSGDSLVELVEVTSDDTNQYWLSSGTEGSINFTRYIGSTTSLNMWPTWSPNESPYYYGTNMLNFSSSSDALSYASYYYDHAMAYPGARSSMYDLYSCLGGFFDINKREFYAWDFMESYNGMNFEHSDAFEKTYWYQEHASNDPDSPVFSYDATPIVGSPIVYTKSYNIPYKLTHTIYNEDGDTSDIFKLQGGRNEVYFYRPQGGDSRIKFYYCSAKYPTIEETTDIRKDVYELKGMAASSQEVEDARIGVDGTVYADLGTAIRTQINDLANGILDALNDDY